MSHVVVIGNGIAGITAARHLRKRSDCRITVVGDETVYHISRPALMYVFMGQLTMEQIQPYEPWFWKRNRIDLLHTRVDHVDTARQHCRCADGTTLAYDTLVVATGSVPARYPWPGIDAKGVMSFYGRDDLERLEGHSRSARHAVVVGGGLIGIEVAEMLHQRGIGVTMLVREASYWRSVLPEHESMLVTRHVTDHRIDLRCSTEVAGIDTDDGGAVCAVRTTAGDRIPCDLVVVAIGVRPRVDLASAAGLAVDRGIVVDDIFRTSAPNVYAVGDCAQLPDGRVEQLWYTARAHGGHVARSITGAPSPYVPEPFYNSAKFFDIEYQTYGTVPASACDADSLLWVHPSGRHLLRIVHRAGTVVGFNALGVRLRAERCQRWIAAGAAVAEVLAHLDEADFDPEWTRMVRGQRFHYPEHRPWNS